MWSSSPANISTQCCLASRAHSVRHQKRVAFCDVTALIHCFHHLLILRVHVDPKHVYRLPEPHASCGRRPSSFVGPAHVCSCLSPLCMKCCFPFSQASQLASRSLESSPQLAHLIGSDGLLRSSLGHISRRHAFA